MRTLPVHSENQWFQLVQTLKSNRQKRWRKGLFFVEGVRSINQLRKNPAWQAEALLYCPQGRLSGWAREILRDIPAPLHLELTAALMEKISDREEGSEIIAIVKMPRTRLADLTIGEHSRLIVLDRPDNPGNLGSIIRSCDAFGVTGIVIAGHAVDPFDPLVIRASAGAFFFQKVARAQEQSELDAWFTGLERAVPGVRIIGTSARTSRHIAECSIAGPVVICFGNESTGLSSWLKSRCHEMAGIPMQGVSSSLNLACAVTAVLYAIIARNLRFAR